MSAGVDIVVGICTKNCASTISKVIEVCDQGLVQAFPGHRAAIIVSDGFSVDGTRELARGVATESELVVLTQRGGPGKGIGVRTILEEAVLRGARAVALVDGDLTSIGPEWIELLLSPILEGASLTVPLYLRHPRDGVITNHLVYPLVNVLFGLGVRQPIGGEFALAGRLAARLLESPLFPAQFGIDIFITVTGAVHGGRVVEAALGVKEHESTKQYADPEALLVPMYYQVSETLFKLIYQFRDHVKSAPEGQPVPCVGKLPQVEPAPVPVDEERLHARFRALVGERVAGGHTFLGPLTEKVLELAERPLAEFTFPVSLWAEAVYRAIAAFGSEGRTALEVLEPLWQGRYLAFVRETEGLSVGEAEERIKAQLVEFRRLRPLVLDAL